MINFYLYREILGGAWHINASTLSAYYPMVANLLKHGHAFPAAPEEQATQSYTIQATANRSGNGKSTDKFVKVIPVLGVMLRDDAECGPVGTRTIAKRLLDADKDPNAIGIILKFDSGGGQASAVPELADAITACQKPVIAFIDGMACSAAMYSAAYCAEIIAYRNTAQVGCIGTMISFSAPQNMATDTSGNTHIRLYADGAEEKNEEFEKALQGDFKLMKERVLNPHNEQFKADMRRLRPAATEEHIKGRTYNASDVVGVLVDSIGSLEFAVNRVVELSEANQVEQSNTNQTIINMNKFPTLANTLGATEIVADSDGYSSLNQEQLQTIETALSTHQASNPAITAANETIVQRDATIAEQTARITELETQVDELGKKAGAESAHVDMTTDSGTGSSVSTYNAVKDILKG